jgi:hypothetical protein
MLENIDHLFAPIMVIGTIMALIFAAGAMWNSIARRRLQTFADELETEEELTFRPPPETPRKVVEQEPSPEDETKTTNTKPIFRQIGAAGQVQQRTIIDENELYVWE